MSDDRDIDDILESLDQLLRSGNHHNDDHTDHTPTPLSGRKAGDAAESSAEGQLETAGEKLFELRDPMFDLPLGEEISLDDIPGAEAVEPEAVEPEAAEPEAAEPEAVEPEAVEPEAVEPEAVEPEAVEPEAVEPEAVEPEAVEPEAVEAPAATQRVVLTEDMLVDNPQGKLSLRVVEGEPEQSEPEVAEIPQDNVVEAAEAEAPAAAESVHLDYSHLEQLMAQVSDDVIAQLQRELPRMIRQSLYHHLNELRQEGDRPDADSE